MAIQKNFKADNVETTLLHSKFGVTNYVPQRLATDLNIASVNVYEGTVVVTVANYEFSDPFVGKARFSNVTTMTELNGEYYYKVDSPDSIVLYDNGDINNSNPLNGSTWYPWTSVPVTIVNGNQTNNNLIVTTYGSSPNVERVRLGWTANDGTADFTVTGIGFLNGDYTFTLSGGSFATGDITFTPPVGDNGGGTVTLDMAMDFNGGLRLGTFNKGVTIMSQGSIQFDNGTEIAMDLNGSNGLAIYAGYNQSATLATMQGSDIQARTYDIQFNTWNGDVGGKTWTIDYQGKFRMPSGGDILNHAGESVLITPSGVTFPLSRDDFESPALLTPTVSATNWGYGFTHPDASAYYTQVMFDGQDEGTNRGFKILDTFSNESWIFDAQGNLSTPADAIIGAPNETTIGLRASGSTYGEASIKFVSDINGTQPYNSKVAVSESGARIHTSGDTKVWHFDPSGNLTLPDSGTILDTNGNNLLVNDRLTAGGKSAVLTSDSTELDLPNGVLYRWAGDDQVKGGVGVGPEGYTIYSEPNKTIWITLRADNPSNNKMWAFNLDGSITFPDGTTQDTAFNYAPQPLVNLDGGIASTMFPRDYVYVDGGGSYVRGILQEDTFDGGDYAAGITEQDIDKVLNGGGA